MDDEQLELELDQHARNWREHPGAKVGAWSVELPLAQLLRPEEGDDEATLVETLLASLRAAR